MTKYSGFKVFAQALRNNRGWGRAWRDPDPQPAYDVIIIGGGGHGLATAYYLAKEHGIKRVAVLEKGWLGGGNLGRNTTIVRSNYMENGNTQFYEHSLKLWENLSQDLNYNVMFSQRGYLGLLHSYGQLDAGRQRVHAMKLNGIEASFLTREQVQEKAPYLDMSMNARYPILGGVLQQRAGTARHDAVAWGFARAADRQGVDIIQQCEVLGFIWKGLKIVGVETTRGDIRAPKVTSAVAGNSGVLAEKAGFQLPIESHLLQAFVTEPIKPLVNCVIASFGMLYYISQSDKGGLVLGGSLDGYNSYAQRGNLPKVEHILSIGKALMPCLSRLRILRHWGGIMDMTMDGSPIICKTPVDGFYMSAGWCYGGFKATPGAGWCLAHTIAKDEPHPLSAGYTIDRFRRGATINESGTGPVPGHH
ncbi:MAG: sarcosine oxidase subunit beta family protein [Rhodobacteraceae bacterium]|nr:sarcosine oxidase subunit beta family protein [Paracoccaceae bacterium]